MTIAELHKAVRERMPYDMQSHVELSVWHFSHMAADTNPEVTVRIYVCGNGVRETIVAGTAEVAFELFKLQLLPALGLAEVAPAMKRLAEMEA